MSRALMMAVTLLVCSVAQKAHSQAFEQYRLDLRLDLPLIGLGAAVSIGALLRRSELPPCAPNCDPAGINPLDRPVIHYDSRAAGTVADIMLPVLVVAPLVLTGIDTQFKGFFEDAVVMTEAVMLTQLITQLTKFAVNRYSPVIYGGDPNRPALQDFDVTRSFFSSHTATTISAATVFTTSYFLRHPDDPMRFVVLAAGAALSLGTGALMVLSGAHFWTDILAGALAGVAVGVLVPVLHVDAD